MGGLEIGRWRCGLWSTCNIFKHVVDAESHESRDGTHSHFLMFPLPYVVASYPRCFDCECEGFVVQRVSLAPHVDHVLLSREQLHQAQLFLLRVRDNPTKPLMFAPLCFLVLRTQPNLNQRSRTVQGKLVTRTCYGLYSCPVRSSFANGAVQ
jgi:hypothetical protein